MRKGIGARCARRLATTTDATAAKIDARFGEGPVDGMIETLVIAAS
jgi:hypothetical protein